MVKQVKVHRVHLAVVALYTLLALVLTWPLAARLATHIPGEATWAFDESTFIWNMWWFKHSLLNLQQPPLETGYIFYPLGVRLTTYTFNLFHAAFGLPLQLGLSLPLANNLTLLFSYVASGYGTYLLVRYLLHKSGSSFWATHPAAFVAGAVFAFSASRMMYVALGHYNFVTIQWFPFFTLFLIKTLRGGSLKNIFLAGLFAALCLYAELTYSVFLLFLTLLVLLFERGTRRAQMSAQQWRESIHSVPFLSALSLLSRAAAIGIVTFVLTAPFVLAVLPDFLDPAYQRPGWGEGLKLSADLVGLVTLTPLHPLSGVDWMTELRAVIEGTSRFSDANTLFLGYAILAVALLGVVVRRRAARVWLWSALFFTVLSLGPLLTINGQNRFNLDGIKATFPLPYALLHYIPILSANRVPNRFGIPLTLSLAVLVGYGAAWLLTQIGKRTPPSQISHPKSHIPNLTSQIPSLLLSGLLLAALLFDQYSVPLPLTDARIPNVYHQIGAEAGQFALMQLPLGWRNSYGTLGAERTQLQYYQAAHRRPMLGGNTSRNPEFKFNYYAGIPLFAALTQTELYRPVDDATRQQAKAQAAELMTLYNIKYLVIHEPIPFRKPYQDTYTATRELALSLIPHQPEPVYQSPGVQAFAVKQAPVANPLTLDFGIRPTAPYRGRGWSNDEQVFAATANWAVAPQAEIFFPVRGGGSRQLSLQIAPFSYPGMPEQRVSLLVNGRVVEDSLSLREGWQTIETTLPPDYLTNGLNRLALKFAHTAQPRQVLPRQTTIGSTGLETPVDIEVNSGADFAFITVNFGAEAIDASAHRRGVNIAVVQPQTGRVTTFKGFDTAANAFEADALRRFVEQIPAGHITVVATQGLAATEFFNADTRAALQSLGLSTQGLAAPFSAIGVKGAAAGAALQAAGQGTAYLRLGANPDTRPLAAAVDKVTISP